MTNRVAMTLRTAALGCALSCLSSISFAATAEPATGATAAANECLTGPKGTAPKGERWYYRVERGTKRHCWYTRAQTSSNVAMQTPPSQSRLADTPDNATADAPIQPSVANARAEIPRVADPVALPSPFPPPAVAASPGDDRSATGAQSAGAPDVTLAERWSDHPNAGQPNQPLQPSTAAPADAAQPSIAAATTQTTATESTPLWILLSVIGLIFALVGIATALIRRFAGSALRPRSDAIWPDARRRTDHVYADPATADIDDAPVMQMDVPPMNWVRIARETAQEHEEQIEDLLSRRTRSAT